MSYIDTYKPTTPTPKELQIAKMINKQDETTLVEIFNTYWQDHNEPKRIFPNTQTKLNEVFQDYTPYDMLNLIENSDNQYFTLDPWATLDCILISADDPRKLVYEYQNELNQIARDYATGKVSKKLKMIINQILGTKE